MNLNGIEKKLGEAGAFLSEMRDVEGRMAGDRQSVFDRSLSGFLQSCRVVDYGLRSGQEKKFKAWREAWDQKLSEPERKLVEFMRVDRDRDVHHGGSTRNAKMEDVDVSGGHSDKSGRLEVASLPGDKTFVRKLANKYTIDGAERKVTDACAEFLVLLKRMVNDYREFLETGATKSELR